MKKYLMKRFALSGKGAADTIKGSLFCALQNFALIMPVGLLYLAVSDLLNGDMRAHFLFYIVGCCVCASLILVTTWFQYNGTFFSTYIESGVRRISLAERLRMIPLSFFGRKDLADLTSAIMNDCSMLETAMSHWVCPLIGAMISVTLSAVGLFFLHWAMALAVLWVLPISLAVTLCSSRVQQRVSRAETQAKVECENSIQEYIEAMPELRSANAEQKYQNKLAQKFRLVERRAIIAEFVTAAFVVSAQLILRLGIATTVLTGAFLLVRGDIDLMMFFLYMLIVSRIYDPLEGALVNLAAIISTKSNIDRMNEIMEYPIQSGTDKLTNSGYDITFDNVRFAYGDGETVLDGVSFTAKQGEVTALVGPSGGGKTTVSRLAARFWDPVSGKITVGGMNIAETDPETLLSMYAIVFQDVTLFNNTIMENIRIGNPNATDEEVMAAARLANVDEFANRLPDKWNSLIGENGCELSGGERQRISIARAFLKNAPIILMDEATASLDVENETLIQQALSRLIKDKTVLIIAHRMRTVASADKIVVLSGGKVAECGTPTELQQQNGIFAKMASQQLRQLSIGAAGV